MRQQTKTKSWHSMLLKNDIYTDTNLRPKAEDSNLPLIRVLEF